MYGHLIQYKKNGKTVTELIVTREIRPIDGKKYIVSGRKAARKICREHNITPWNF